MRTARIFTIASFLILLSMSAMGQVVTGTYPFGQFTGGPDAVNLGNLNASWTIPIVNKAGRGQNFVYNLNYDSSVYYPVTSGSSTSWQPVANWGWQGLGTSNLVYATYDVAYTSGTCGETDQFTWQSWVYSGLAFSDQNGVVHYFPGAGGSYVSATGSPGCPPLSQASPPGPEPSAATDGSGLVATYTVSSTGFTATITTKYNTTITPPMYTGGAPASSAYNSTDRNGNEITSSGSGTYTDTLGKTALSISGYAPGNTTMSYTNPSSGSSTYTVSYSAYNIKTNFGCSGVSEYSASSAYLVNQIELPDGRLYSFTYEPTPGYPGYYTGRPVSVTLPTGGSVSYTYPGSNNGINCADGSAAGLTRTTPDGEWTYSRALNSSSQWTTTVTSPTYNNGVTNQTNQSVSTFLTSSGTGNLTKASLYEIERQLYSGSASGGTLLETNYTCYETNPSNCSSAGGDNGTAVAALSNVEGATLWPGGLTSGYINTYDSFGNILTNKVYDYASGNPFSSPLQATTTSYTTSYGGDLPTEVLITNGQSTPTTVSDTKYAYTNTVTATTGTPSHVSSLNPANISSVQKLVTGTTYQPATTYTYYDTGNVETATDVNLNVTTYTYGSSSCGNSFPTANSSPTGGTVVTSLGTSATWNCVGGVLNTSFDVNGNQTTYTYGSDPYWRPVTITQNATGAQTSYSYPTTSSNSSTVSMNFNGGSSTSTSVTTYDGLGRTILQQSKQGPSATQYDSFATAYDALGRVATQTLPYSGSLGQYTPTNPGTTTTYDPLSRTTQVADGGGGYKAYAYTQNDVLVKVGPKVTLPATENYKERNLEYNGAGWLASVCEVVTTTTPAGGLCGQSTGYTGYLTQYTYDGAGRLTNVKQNAQSSSYQTRTVAYDYLGRKTSETIPEWSAGTGTAGTTTYNYDSASDCTGSSTGDLIETIDNIGNKSCFTYDKLHRPTYSQVISGLYVSVTPITHAVYDAATYSGTAMTNAKGQVAEAYTCATSACTTKLTDAFFSASPITTGTTKGGVLSQMWESTPHSGGYFLTQESFYPNGSVGAMSAELGTASIGIPSMTYGLDGEGRLYSASDGTHNLVTATAYNYASLPTSITYGNASTGSANDVDQFSFDPNTYRPTNITYNINPTTSAYTVTTALTWNPNSSLQQMVYTDGNDSTKNQTCKYQADYLSRIASANCGTSTWAQTFSYDPFGNIKKTGTGGSISYSAGYSTATNQVSSGITPAPTYDGNGNQKTAMPATLTWNALNQPVSIIAGTTTSSATYDALGRMVEKGVGTTGTVYTQFVYNPDGTNLAVYSGGLTKGTISLPGGSTAIYNSTGLSYIRHKDWLGSSRLATTWAHAVYSKEAYAPFGETYNEAGTADRSFTGQDQNVVTGSLGNGVYDFLFRKYDPSAGRWLSPDPAGWGAVNTTAPQSLNRYAYVMNDPMNAVDLDGLSCYTNWINGVSVQVDDGDGLGCAAAGVNPSTPGDPSGTNDGTVSDVVFGGPQAVGDEMAYLLGGFEWGLLPVTITYQPTDPFTLSFQGSAGMDAINSKIAANCSAQSGQVAVGTGEAFVNTIIDGTAGGALFWTPEAQLGAFNASYVRNGGTVSITVTNPLSLNSLLFHAPALFGINNPKSGPFSTIHQVLQIQEADPCH